MNIAQSKVKIISNKKIARGYFVLILEAPPVYKNASPGQFIHVRINDSNDPLLRRPLSINNISFVKRRSRSFKIFLKVLYEVKGKGTSLLANKQPGEMLDILGPLGRGFNYNDINGGQSVIHVLIAGGMGIAPLVFLANRISDSITLKKNGDDFKILVLIGAATQRKVLFIDELKQIGCSVFAATEDGSRGFKGKVTDLFTKKTLVDLERDNKKNKRTPLISVYACGPKPMLNKLAKECTIDKIPLQVSFEEFMGCGLGACLGCAIETKTGYQRVCKDGPVFDAKDIAWRF